jgi:fatty-acyl-CoA synthase
MPHRLALDGGRIGPDHGPRRGAHPSPPQPDDVPGGRTVLSTMQDVPLTITSILRHAANVASDREVRTMTGDGVRTVNYARLGARAAQLAHGLRALGVDGDQRVATLQWNNQEHLEAYFAVPAMGAVLHTLNPRLPADQLELIANHAADQVVLVDQSLIGTLARVLPRLRTLRQVVVVGAGGLAAADLDGLRRPGLDVLDHADLLAGQPDSFPWPDLDERTAAAMCYTSGTTGDPMGVVYSHRSTYLHSMQLCMGDAMALSPHDRVLPVVPMFHANGWGFPYAAPLVGADLLLPDCFLGPAALAATIARERPTIAAGVPTVWSGLLAHLEKEPIDLSCLRRLVIGGAACPVSLMRAFQDRHGVHVLHAWGMTETSPLGSVCHPPAGLPAELEWRYRASQGRVPGSLRARLVDEHGVVLPWDGQAQGELEVRGPWVAGSYYGQPASDRFHDGWLRTGDVATISHDGFITLTDRTKDVIKSGGEWISSVALENTLMAHAAVAEACVVAVPDERWGERPLAVVVLREERAETAGALRDHLAASVPRWQLPERWTFVAEVPRTSVGKFDKKLVRQRYAAGEFTVSLLGPDDAT